MLTQFPEDSVAHTHNRLLPGFGLSLGLTLTYLSIMVLLPFTALVIKTTGLTWGVFWQTVTAPRVIASYRLSFYTSFAAAVINAVMGLLTAWVLVRYPLPGKRILDAAIDLPFALPTAVAGIALTSLYAQSGWLGRWIPFKVAFSPLGITVALTFIGFPFGGRALQPLLEDLGTEVEEAATSLGANRWQLLWRVILPELLPGLLAGFALAFARGIGEYGSVVFISGNMPMKTEITPLLIITKLEQYEYAQATAIAVVMLLFSFALLLVINQLQRRLAWRIHHA
jgi:sulfate/thiosulfate transport system permease protein